MQNSKGPSRALSNSLCRQNEDQHIICPPKTSLHLLTQNEIEQRPNISILGLPFTSKLLFRKTQQCPVFLFFFCPNFILYFLFILFTADFFFLSFIQQGHYKSSFPHTCSSSSPLVVFTNNALLGPKDKGRDMLY